MPGAHPGASKGGNGLIYNQKKLKLKAGNGSGATKVLKKRQVGTIKRVGERLIANGDFGGKKRSGRA